MIDEILDDIFEMEVDKVKICIEVDFNDKEDEKSWRLTVSDKDD